MKIYEIRDEHEETYIGTLLYYEKEKSYIVELSEELDEWNCPLLFCSFVKKNIYTIPREISNIWVNERVIPPERQNIKSILMNHKLKEYDEHAFLEISEGRCSQDSLYIKKTKELPEFIKERSKKNITECVVCGDGSLLCFFNNGLIKKTDLRMMKRAEGIDKVLKNRKLMESGKVATGGYSVTFNDSIDISAADLYKYGMDIPLKKSDFIAFVRKNILDTTQAGTLLECSRQNLSYMVRHEQLSPVKEEVRGNLYLKGDVLKNKW